MARVASAFFSLLLMALLAAPPTCAQSDVIKTLSQKVRELQRAGKYAEAIPLAKRAAELARRKYGAANPNYAAALSWLAGLYDDQGRFDEAERLYRQVLDIFSRALNPEDPALIPSLKNLAQFYKERDRFSEAVPLFQRALKIAEEVWGPDSGEVGSLLFSLGELSRVQGRLGEAEPMLKRALLIRERILKPEDHGVGVALDGLAMLYSDQGRYDEAEILMKRALAIAEGGHVAPDRDVGTSFNNLALLYQQQGRFAEAEQLYKRALAIDESVLGTRAPSLASDLNNLAALYKSQGRLADAETLYLRANSIFESAVGPNHPQVALSLSNLALLYAALGRSTEAEQLMKRALAIDEKALNPEHPDIGTDLNNLAGLYRQQGRFVEAEQFYERALAIYQKALGPNHPTIAISLTNLGEIAYTRHAWQEALDRFRQAGQIVQQRSGNRMQLGGTGTAGRDSGANELALNARVFKWLVSTAWHLAADTPENRETLTDASYRAGQWASQSAAGAALAQMAARQAKSEGQLANIVRARQDLATEGQALDKQLIGAISEPLDRRSRTAEQSLRTRLVEIDRQIEALDARLAKDFPEYFALTSPQVLSIADTQALLGPQEALVQFMFVNAEAFAWVVTNRQLRWVRLLATADRIQNNVQALRCGLDAGTWKGEGAARCSRLLDVPFTEHEAAAGKPLPFDLRKAHELYSDLFGPVADMIKDRQILLVPSGPMTSLPLAVLVTQEPGTPYLTGLEDYRNVAWLGLRQPIMTLPTVASLQSLRKFAKAIHAERSFIGIGNPLLDGDSFNEDDKIRAQQARENQTCPKTIANARQRDFRAGRGPSPIGVLVRGGGLADVSAIRRQVALPETADELCAVARALGVENSDDVLLGANATVTTIKKISREDRLRHYQIVHFATHGVLAGEASSYLDARSEPGLLLTPPAEATAEDDGLLTASEVAQLKLNADWVILSACNTAAGVSTGAEALSGLARAFFYAGARALLVSHWAVDSTAAVKLTTGTFSQLKAHPNIGKAEAVRRSMTAIIESGPSLYAHPTNWAPFVVVGEGVQ
jgi:CHAT domain-containing protein/tetratricopeptide (TPR) repeat protein